MKNFDSRVYSIADFLEWRDSNLLNLSPDFQRRSVWSEKAKSYLTDSILKKKPIPKLIIAQELQGRRNMRVVVDGQQRLRAIIGFHDGDFKISRAHDKELAGKTFDTLPPNLQKEFLSYELGVDLLFNPEYAELLDIFARINTYTVSLKKQERLNAAYVGYFKQAAFNLGLDYVNYWIDANVLTKAQVTRMAEAELAGDLLVSMLGGVQTNKSLENYYKRFEDQEGDLPKFVDKFHKIMSVVGEIYPPQELHNTNWSRLVLFYTLFISIGQILFGFEGIDRKLRLELKAKDYGKVRIRLDEVSIHWDKVSDDYEGSEYSSEFKNFVRLSKRSTVDTQNRRQRVEYLAADLIGHLSS